MLASIDVGLNGAIIQENKTISDQKSSAKSFYEVNALSQIQKWRLHVGVAYMIVSSTNALTVTTNETLSSSNLYFLMRYGFFKSEFISVSLYYNPSVQAKYTTTGNAADLWTGSAYALQMIAQPEITENFKLTGGVMYHSEAYSSKSTTSASSTVTSFTRTTLIPVLGLQYGF